MQTEQVEELALCGDTQEHVARTLGIYSLRRMSISERSPLALFLALGELSTPKLMHECCSSMMYAA